MNEERLAALLGRYRRRGWRIATAESCTGGLIAAALTETPGSSDVFDRGFVTYTNQAKSDLLGVAEDLLIHHGAVSAEVAAAMAEGALARSQADIAIAVTGIAGPDGGSRQKPVGLVYLGLARREADARVERCDFRGDRGAIRAAALSRALDMLGAEVS